MQIESIDEAENELFILKTILACNENEDEIKGLLRKTVNVRYQLLMAGETDLKENFSFFFVDPKYVSGSILVLYFSKYSLYFFFINKIVFIFYLCFI